MCTRYVGTNCWTIIASLFYCNKYNVWHISLVCFVPFVTSCIIASFRYSWNCFHACLAFIWSRKCNLQQCSCFELHPPNHGRYLDIIGSFWYFSTTYFREKCNLNINSGIQHKILIYFSFWNNNTTLLQLVLVTLNHKLLNISSSKISYFIFL